MLAQGVVERFVRRGGEGALELARSFPELRREAGELPRAPEEASAQFLVFEAVTALVRNAAADGPLLVVLEDLHWADHESLRLLVHATGRLEGQRVAIVFTYETTT